MKPYLGIFPKKILHKYKYSNFITHMFCGRYLSVVISIHFKGENSCSLFSMLSVAMSLHFTQSFMSVLTPKAGVDFTSKKVHIQFFFVLKFTKITLKCKNSSSLYFFSPSLANPESYCSQHTSPTLVFPRTFKFFL